MCSDALDEIYLGFCELIQEQIPLSEFSLLFLVSPSYCGFVIMLHVLTRKRITV